MRLWGMGERPSGNWILCILALKSDIWWHQICHFFWESIDHSRPMSRVRLTLGHSYDMGDCALPPSPDRSVKAPLISCPLASVRRLRESRFNNIARLCITVSSRPQGEPKNRLTVNRLLRNNVFQKKNVQLFIFWITLLKPTLMSFGMLNREKSWREYLTDLSTSPVRCSHFTSGNLKKNVFLQYCSYACFRLMFSVNSPIAERRRLLR